MGKREVITRFVILGAAWIAVTAVIGQAVGGVAGDVIEGAAVLLLLFVAWSAFTPNARLFGRVIGTGFSPLPKVAITFDDGPSPEHTPAVLDALRSAGARSTFFVLGRNVRAHPELARRIVAEGHELASHGDDHSLLTFAGPSAIAHQFRAAEEAVSEAIGTSVTHLFRPPHGYRGPFLAPVARRLGYRIVGWTGSIFDTARPGVDVIVDRCAGVIAPGAIVLLHDGDGSGQGGDRSQTVEALPRVLETVRARGLEPVTVSELAEDLKPHRHRVPKAAAFGAIASRSCSRSRASSTCRSSPTCSRRQTRSTCSRRCFANLVSVGGQGAHVEGGLRRHPRRRGRAGARRRHARRRAGDLHRLPAEHRALRPPGRGGARVGGAAQAPAQGAVGAGPDRRRDAGHRAAALRRDARRRAGRGGHLRPGAARGGQPARGALGRRDLHRPRRRRHRGVGPGAPPPAPVRRLRRALVAPARDQLHVHRRRAAPGPGDLPAPAAAGLRPHDRHGDVDRPDGGHLPHARPPTASTRASA